MENKYQKAKIDAINQQVNLFYIMFKNLNNIRIDVKIPIVVWCKIYKRLHDSRVWIQNMTVLPNCVADMTEIVDFC